MTEDFPSTPDSTQQEELVQPYLSLPNQAPALGQDVVVNETAIDQSVATVEADQLTGSRPEAKKSFASVLQDTIESGFSENLMGEQIVDRFVGAVIALGVIETSSGKKLEAKDILDDLAKTPIIRPDPYKSETLVPMQYLETFTRTNGLRGAVHMLGKDFSTSRMLPTVNERLASSRYFPTLFISKDQVMGYLDTLAVKAGQGDSSAAWVNTILNEMSGIEVNQKDMEDAVKKAREVGANIDLLALSSHIIQEIANQKA